MSYISNSRSERESMLEALGVASTDDLFADIPEEIRLKGDLSLPPALSEPELLREISALGGGNADANQYASFLGGGSYDHFVPSAVGHITSRSEFYTSYTPYQPEISQGMLQSIYEYQTMICNLTGMDVANASMYDGASATAESALLASRTTGRDRVIVSVCVHPAYRAVLETYAKGVDLQVVEIGYADDGGTNIAALEKAISEEVAAVIVSHPNFFGCLENVERIEKITHRAGALLSIVVDPISLGLLKPPGSYNADLAMGEGQSLGNQMSFGGPYVGFFAVKKENMRRLPGRIVGATTDNQGQRGFVLTLQAREQHIRREKATSNICTNQALNALASGVYLALMGVEGLKTVANLCLQKSHYGHERLTSLSGLESRFSHPFFKEFVLKLPMEPAELNALLLKKGIIGGLDLGRFYPELEGCMLFCITEMRTKSDIDTLTEEIEKIL